MIGAAATLVNCSLVRPGSGPPSRHSEWPRLPVKIEDKTVLSRFAGLDGRRDVILNELDPAERKALLDRPPADEALSALTSCSPALTQALSGRPGLVRRLFLEKGFERPSDPQGAATRLKKRAGRARNLTDLQAALREFRLEEISRLAVRDLTGRADLSEVMATLSALADACLGLSLETAVRLTSDRYDCPARDLGFRPLIMGLGKLGGRELNYSSDVDLVYLYQTCPAGPRAPFRETAAQFLFTQVSRAISELTEDGLVFRVDLDLRPGGKDGAQAQSLEAARNHYLILGQPWERLAWLKARPVAGDIEAGRIFLNDLAPFIFRRHLDYTTLEELKDLKTRFTREKKARMGRIAGYGRPAEPVVDVKLSPGGIREAEFFVQALILTFGGRLPHLRQPATLAALTALARENLITGQDADDLTKAYVFLRTVEHRLQLRELTQTQTLPRRDETRRSLAVSLGYETDPWPRFMADLAGHMSQVTRRFELLLTETTEKPKVAAGRETRPPDWAQRLLERLEDEDEARGILTRAGFKRPEAALAACRNIKEERYLPGRLARYSAHLERLLPAMLAEMAAGPDPDRGLLHLERFLTSIGPKAGFLVLLEENPHLINLLSVLFGHSDYLADILIKHPAILDSLIDRRSAAPFKDKPVLAEELELMLGQEEDPETCLTIIRRFKNDETLRVGLYDLLDRLSWPEIQNQLTDLAEVVMGRTMRLAYRTLFRRDGEPEGLAVMGLGRLGGRELSYGSDLDLIFILDDRVGTGLDLEQAVRLAQRFISYLSLPLEAGPGYEIDSRLRPSGMWGPLVVTLDSFAAYHRTSQLWEKQALLKIRQVLGPPALGASVGKLTDRTVYGGEIPADAAEQIHGLRLRMTKERAKVKPGWLSLKFSPGGLVDAEFLTQYLQLVHGRRHRGGIRAANTRAALTALVRRGLGPAGLTEAAGAHDLISRLASRLGLIYGRHGDRAAYTPEEIAAAGGAAPGADPYSTLVAAMSAIKAAYNEVFGGEEDRAG
ncbi:MAG: bifunctional [glutamate--ammonia ligase]-adenylyl-L-tyrosine phosphorylase/[glutamate--ammonia-ligase] adenylyltransferase [Thermodesulfobacteriota bacterium]